MNCRCSSVGLCPRLFGGLSLGEAVPVKFRGRIKRHGLQLVCLLLCQAAFTAVVRAEDCAVIVSKSNPVDTLSAADLKKMFSGEKTTWPNGTKVVAITPRPDSPNYEIAVKRTTGMTSPEFKRYYIQLSFLGNNVSPPRTLDPPSVIARFVGSSPGAISCIPAANADATTKILKIK